jgi:sterol desaturase/sphingolipid hydroxylase (fatty acid hydroxylase superfamily)
MEHRMQNTFNFAEFFWILQAVADTLLHSSKRNQIPFGAETKGAK